MKKFTGISLIVGLLVLLTLATAGMASVSAAVYTMPTPLSQQVGVIDKEYNSYKELDCRGCHGGISTADMHHLTRTALDLTKGCVACHDVDATGKVVAVERNCVVCHTSSGHHLGETAQAGSCTFCHDANLIQDQGTGFLNPPTYAPSAVTPTVFSCANCHRDFNQAWNPNLDPATQIKNGVLEPNKASHHGAFNATLDNQCDWCHDRNVPQVVESPIRMCESCHTIDTLHGIAGHTLSNDRCVGCHGDYMLGTDVPKPDTLAPTIATISKNYVQKNQLLTITGANFNDSYRTGSGSGVYFSFIDATGERQSVLAAPRSWSSTSVTVLVPNLQSGLYDLYVKTPVTKSAVKPITIVSPPVLSSITPNVGLAGATVKLSGQNLNIGNAKVKFSAGGTSVTVTPSRIIDNNNLEVVVPANLLVGKYTVTVLNDYGTSTYTYYTVATTPKIMSISTPSTTAGKSVTITGSNLSIGTKPIVYFVSATGVVTQANVGSYSATKVTFTVPAAGAGKYQIKVNNGWADSNYIAFTIK